ncbi:single-stranded DNA-binding protein [Photobacterium leiognathi]|uniref:single-stranded DNA-binding protein n=1 Tax=Photobacterium leiognathi TaxID=553611 RepID=UPI002982B21B|nr:single-stranded DNA-binding protein [Photobacterium leiognathi]
MKLVIEIFKENELVDTRILPANANRGEIKLHSQVGYAHLGGKFPVEMSIPLEEGQPHYMAGRYELDQKSFVVGQYNRLEFSRNMILLPINEK